MAKLPRHDDLFEIFPDLPRKRHRSPEEQMGQVQRQVDVIRQRAHENILRQRAAAERVRTAIAGRFRGRSKV
jgi:hypothetical protein